MEIHIIVQAVIEDRCNLRTVIISQGFSLNNRCHDNDLLVSKIQVVTLIERNASSVQVKISCLCLKLIKHGTDDRIGSYIAFCKGIGLGEQVALKRIISIYRTCKERIVSNIIGCFCLIQEIIARNAKVVLNQISNLRNGITVCGIKLPDGLTEASKLPEPIFTPSTKAELGDHDENISFERCCEIVGEDVATQLKEASLAIYKAAAEYAATRGIIIADTKFEFGFIDGKLTLIDECLTPDSSRFWPAEGYSEGHVQPSYDKQYVRDWLKAHWDMQGEPPHLPEEVIEGTSERYRTAFQIITGTEFVPLKETNVTA